MSATSAAHHGVTTQIAKNISFEYVPCRFYNTVSLWIPRYVSSWGNTYAHTELQSLGTCASTKALMRGAHFRTS